MMLDDDRLYSPFSPYSTSSFGLGQQSQPQLQSTTTFSGSPFGLEMKRTQDSIGGPETGVKKARQYPPGAFDPAHSYFAAPQLNTANLSAVGLGNPGQSLTFPAMNGMGMPQPGMPSPMYTQSQLSSSPGTHSIANPPSPSGMQGLYPSGNLTIAQQPSQLQGGVPPSPISAGPGQQFSQQMNMLNGMGMPGMFGSMPIGMTFGFPMANAFQQSALGGQMAAMNPVQAAAQAAAGNSTGRTVYVGNLPGDASVDELLNLVHFGPLESVRVLPERNCVFISFLDGATAAAFHTDATIKKLALHGQELKIGWGKPSPVPSQVLLSISQSNASRNVYLGGLDEGTTEEWLRDTLSPFGLIDQVKIVRDKNIGFVHFLSISTATKVVATLPTLPEWAGKRINYGKDRCAYVPKSQQQQTSASQHAQAVVQQAGLSPMGMNFSPFASTFGMAGYGDVNAMAAAASSQMNRTVYLGNIHPETTVEDLCNTIRGGALQSIRYLQDKHIAFVTFIEPASAFAFHNTATYTNLTLNNRRLKVGWGKHSGSLPPALAVSVQSGATRNVYIGNIEDFEKFSVEKLKSDFGEFGEIELVNYLKEKNCGFVNFTNITNAIKAIEGIRNKPEYANLRIAHGKDRCANAPRAISGSMVHHSNRKASGGANSSPQPPRSPNEQNETSVIGAPGGEPSGEKPTTESI